MYPFMSVHIEPCLQLSTDECIMSNIKAKDLSDFCDSHYFAVPENASEQLYYFGGLMSWLLSLSGQKFTPAEQVFVQDLLHH